MSRSGASSQSQSSMLDTVNIVKSGPVLFAEMAAPPMNLLGPELIGDLVTLIERAESDDTLKVLVFKSADPDYFISHLDVTRISENRAAASRLAGERGTMKFRWAKSSKTSTDERTPDSRINPHPA